MISSFAFVLFLGKAAFFIYNLIQTKIPIKHNPEYTYERKNICKKTMQSAIAEMLTYGLIALIAFLTGH